MPNDNRQSITRMFKPVMEVIETFMTNNCLQAGAALAYYSMFALAPILIIIMTVTGYFLGEDIAQKEIFSQVNQLVGANNAQTILGVIHSTQLHGQNLLLTIVTALGLMLAATGVFGTLESTLNRIWQADLSKINVFRQYAMTRLRSFGILLLIGFLLLSTQILNGAINVSLHYFGNLLPEGMDKAVILLNGTISFLVSTLLFATIFKTFSRIRNRWRDVLVGGLFTSFLFNMGKYLITLYVSNSNVVSSYGAASSVIALMLWSYYSSLILLLGACFTYVFSRYHDPLLMTR